MGTSLAVGVRGAEELASVSIPVSDGALQLPEDKGELEGLRASAQEIIARLPIFDMRGVSSCDAGTSFDGSACVADISDTHICPNGTPSARNAQGCSACDSGYRLIGTGAGSTCLANAYACTDGTAASGQPSAHNENRCISCNGALLLDATTLTCMACVPSRDGDCDGTPNADDVDTDNDGLIEINSLEDLDFARHNLAGTSRQPGASAMPSTAGAPTTSTANCATDADGDGVYLCGYELTRSLDFNAAASYTSGSVNNAWRTGKGWLPIGDNSPRFSGIFEGNGNTISNLKITRKDTDYIGLFGYIGAAGEVRHLRLSNAQIAYTGTASLDASVGPLAGQSAGVIADVGATGGSAAGGNSSIDYIGGLVGWNLDGGTIVASHATGVVNSKSYWQQYRRACGPK